VGKTLNKKHFVQNTKLVYTAVQKLCKYRKGNFCTESETKN